MDSEEQEKLKHAISDFSDDMLRTLRRNSHKHGWDEMHIRDIWPRIRDELDELRLLVHDMEHPPSEEDRRKIAKEATDIANFALFAWYYANDVCQPREKVKL